MYMVWSLKKANAALDKAAFVSVLSSAQSNQTHWNGSECKLSKLRQQTWQATIINYQHIISNPSHIQSTDVFPNQMSFPSLPLAPWDLCWMCWIRWRDVGFVGSATRSRERFFEPPERRTAAMRIAMRPLEFSVDFFPLKKRREGLVLLWGEEFGITPDWTHVCQPQKARWLKRILLLKLVLEGVL